MDNLNPQDIANMAPEKFKVFRNLVKIGKTPEEAFAEVEQEKMVAATFQASLDRNTAAFQAIIDAKHEETVRNADLLAKEKAAVEAVRRANDARLSGL